MLLSPVCRFIHKYSFKIKIQNKYLPVEELNKPYLLIEELIPEMVEDLPSIIKHCSIKDKSIYINLEDETFAYLKIKLTRESIDEYEAPLFALFSYSLVGASDRLYLEDLLKGKEESK